ncbi:MAG: hypothetical protein A2381_19755 [Bdellovibrionales bacterium RIFOXYB1_FULL_37_110]|nr:MAG: hypothetical protein A2181_06580 [Bdellovibrionales bacterium RIFOXYA1_FULL_38_20]OFZ45468.1 MAG: hypothetical protein A2417_18060 [Bdellovibrionales bacterium RIFOXYC1_FULL_37_79]OFZ55088.1 MAG: hypothetical protein A2328_09335 [Bdellovibrionales bacterium RIFOXYB2_FULL_36_6]OFZ61018.1 MAG: hypothetical protein A2381_19755 [Bdellovibrionales bacterium RIFOXYB1_FULL_37_110]OFZ63469.1 MAG: hypothetical protein A2577_06275 [Bdellovibrionales bacterium RIFOXYD1_FULL_36_51]
MIPQAFIDIQNPLVHSFALLLSFVILYYGAEFVLSSAEKTGKALGLSPLVIGLAIVGFGTSLPELFVSQMASYKKSYEIAFGNIIGSNVANILLILGVSAIIYPLSMGRRDIKRQLKRHLAVTILLLIIMQFKVINWIAGIILLSYFGYYLSFTFRKMAKRVKEEHEIKPKIGILDIIKLVLGFCLLFFGGDLLVCSGTKLGELLSISPYVISAIFVAVGTSFPELVTSLVACIKKRDVDLVTGNIIGSNIFNIALILGSCGFYNIVSNSTYWVEMVTLVILSIVFLILAKFRPVLDRKVGVLFLLGYVGMVLHWTNF